MRNATKRLASIAIVVAMSSCQTYSHVVVSKQSLMDSKTGKIQQVQLDSTFQMYDKVKFNQGVITRVGN